MRHASPIVSQPYWTHLMEVHASLICAGVTDGEELLAAILHDAIEDFNLSAAYLSEAFTPRIAAIVEIVSKQEPYSAEAFYSGIMNAPPAIAEAAMRIKVWDRINNLLTNMANNTAHKAALYVVEARKYFNPMAKSVGIETELIRAIRYIENVLAAGN